MRTIVTACIVGAVALMIAGCREKQAKEPSTGVNDNATPVEGKVVGPIAVSFLGFETHSSRSEKGAKFRILNSSGKPIHNLYLTLRYLDASGAELDTFPWSIGAFPALLDPGETSTEVMGAGIPDDCISVEVVVREWD